MDSSTREADAVYVAALARLLYLSLGLYAWEYLSHLDHDWCLVVRGTWPWRWPLTTWAYLICRNSLLINLIFSVSTISGLPCTDAIVYLSNIVVFLLTMSSSCLLAVRTVAIWSRAPWVIATCAVGFLTLLAATIFALVIIRVDDVPSHLSGRYNYACVRLDPKYAMGIKLSVTANDVTNWSMFLLMFLGLWLQRRAPAIGLMRVLRTQSVALLLLAMAVDIPLLLLTWMEIHGIILNMGFAVAGLLLGIGTTRMARSLYRTVQVKPTCAEHSDNSAQRTLELSTVNESVHLA